MQVNIELARDIHFANPLRMQGKAIWELAHKGAAEAQNEVLLFLLIKL